MRHRQEPPWTEIEFKDGTDKLLMHPSPIMRNMIQLYIGFTNLFCEEKAHGIRGRLLLNCPSDMPRGTDYQEKYISVRNRFLYVALRRPWWSGTYLPAKN